LTDIDIVRIHGENLSITRSSTLADIRKLTVL